AHPAFSKGRLTCNLSIASERYTGPFCATRYPIYTVFLTYYLEAHSAKLGDGSTYQISCDRTVFSVIGDLRPNTKCLPRASSYPRTPSLNDAYSL
ncbi:hypothetical protein BBP40_011900, partial [Aspergillus hancockii]